MFTAFRTSYQVPLMDRIKDPFKFPWWFRPDNIIVAYDGVPDAVQMYQLSCLNITLVVDFSHHPKNRSASLFEGNEHKITYHHNSALFLRDWLYSGCKFGFSSEAYEP